jgi:peptide chain release factor 2
MRAEVQNNVEAIGKSVALLKRRIDWETAAHRMEEFDAMIEDPTLWDDPARAQKLMRDRQGLKDAIEGIEALEREASDNAEMVELGEMEGDAEVVAEAEAAIAKLVDVAAEKELEALLDGEADGNDTFLEINAGAGGTEACDWAEMLQRMYVRWAGKRGFDVELQSQEAGGEAGIKSAV